MEGASISLPPSITKAEKAIPEIQAGFKQATGEVANVASTFKVLAVIGGLTLAFVGIYFLTRKN